MLRTAAAWGLLYPCTLGTLIVACTKKLKFSSSPTNSSLNILFSWETGILHISYLIQTWSLKLDGWDIQGLLLKDISQFASYSAKVINSIHKGPDSIVFQVIQDPTYFRIKFQVKEEKQLVPDRIEGDGMQTANKWS